VKGSHQNSPKNNERGNGYLSCPETKEGKIRVKVGKNKLRCDPGRIQDPAKHCISKVPQNSVESVRDKAVEFFLDESFA